MRFLKCALNAALLATKHKIQLDKYISCGVYRKNFCISSCMYKINIKVKDISLSNYLKKIQREYEDLCKDHDYRSNIRWIELHSAIEILKERQLLEDNIDNLKELLQEKDDELRKLAEKEKQQFEGLIEELNEKLLQAIIPRNKDDSSNSVVVEVQAGVGGQEAMLFAKELFDMYCNFAKYKGWELEIADYFNTDIGGIRHATALISGNSVFQYFKYEAGIHRVQRIPATEKGGRTHTSTVSVVALPQPADVDVNVNQKDLKIETKRSSGAGGQHVNTTDSAVRIVHLPTGIAVECQVDRSQIKNRKMAMARLTALLYQREVESQNADMETKRKHQVRTMNRNEKIRTYNYSQDRITDHRLQGVNIHNLKGFLEGGESLDDLIQKLDQQNRTEVLQSIVSSDK